MPNGFAKFKKFAGAISLLFLLWGSSVGAQIHTTASFIIDKGYDAKDRSAIEATLEQTTPHGFFYFEKEYMASIPESEQARLRQSLQNIANELEQIIWPRLSQLYGEVGQGPDGSSSVTVLFHKMDETAGGYFSPVNLYSKAERPESNERNILFLNIEKLPHPIIKSLLAHEFQHVISFYQKDKRLRQSEDVWLNELRSEYAPTYLGYDDQYRRSNMEQRVAAFLENPSDSLTEWSGGKYDYGSVNLFGQYLVDRFGLDALRTSMQSSVIGIESLEAAFKSASQGKNFSDIFGDWLVASFLNDCTVSPQNMYCYKNPNLNSRILRVSLAGMGQGQSVKIAPAAKPWAGNWYEFTTNELTQQTLELHFSSSDASASFRIPYILKRRGMPLEVHEFSLGNQKLDIQFDNFGNDIFGLAVMPFQQGSRRNFSSSEPQVPFELKAVIAIKGESGTSGSAITPLTEAIPQQLFQSAIKLQTEQALIESLQKQIAELEQQLFLLLQKRAEEAAQKFSYEWKRDLYVGLRGDKDVEALQSALGAENVYSGPITGNLGPLTEEAVKKFQTKYGLPQLGRAGPQTRAKLNEIYKK